MDTNERTITEAIQDLRSMGYCATPDKLREYEKRGLIGRIERHAEYFRRYKGADLRNIMRVMDFIALRCTMEQAAKSSSNKENLNKLRGELSRGEVTQNKKNGIEKLLLECKEAIERYQECARAVKNQEQFFTGMIDNYNAAKDIFQRTKRKWKK